MFFFAYCMNRVASLRYVGPAAQNVATEGTFLCTNSTRATPIFVLRWDAMRCNAMQFKCEQQIMDTGEAVVDDEDDECDALFTMDDVLDGTADTKKQNTEEVN